MIRTRAGIVVVKFRRRYLRGDFFGMTAAPKEIGGEN
jgi:hypothetical protein